MTTAELLTELPRVRALIVGDICLDRWCRYDPAAAQPSRETGIPRTAVIATENTPGAGGTIASNLRALGVERVSVLGAIGNDGYGWELRRALRERGIGSEFLVESDAINTFTYTKLLNSVSAVEDLPRVDTINCSPIPVELEEELSRQLENAWPHFDVVLVSDQAETASGGIVTGRMRGALCGLAMRERDKVVWVDSRERGEQFEHVVLKVNRDEADAARGRGLAPERLRALIVTHGSDGAEITAGTERFVVPTRRVQAVDVCGAGDSFSAGAACALHLTGSVREAARFGNLVASITVTKPGTGTASPAELLAIEAELP